MGKKTILTILGILIVILSAILIASSLVGNKELATYTVTFDTNGGTIVNSQTINEKDKVDKPINPTKNGYKFVEWTYQGKTYDFNYEVTSDMTLTAKWEKLDEEVETFIVKFNTDGGSKILDQTVKKGDKLEMPKEPTKEGYTFKEWTFNNKIYDFDLVVDKDMELKAVWEKVEQKFTVKFDTKGGSTVKSQTVIEGNKVSKPSNPTRSGYTFEGWTLNGSAYNFNSKVTKDITLVANWKKIEEVKPEVKSYTVTFDTKGGSTVKSQTVAEGNKVSKPENPTRSGYTFEGWTLNGSAYDFNSKVTKNITLVANWKKVEEVKPEVKSYTVTFDTKGGSSVKSQTVKEGNKVTKPSDPTRSGYTFEGWTLNGSSYDFNTKVTKDITLVANWKEIEKPVVKNYTIKVSMVDSYSPDRILSVYENGSKIGFKSISYTDGTYLCSGSNSTVSVGDITGETRFKVILNDGTGVTATVE